MVLSSPLISVATCWLRVVMSPTAETSTNRGDSTSSRPYWSCWLMASAQESSIFWNWCISGLTVEVATAGLLGPLPGSGRWLSEGRKEQTERTNKTDGSHYETPNENVSAIEIISL